jgi:prohibitin 2
MARAPVVAAFVAVAAFTLGGCAYATVEPGHRGLMFEPNRGGLQHEVLQPGRYRLGMSARVDDFPVTYSSHVETVQSVSSEGLSVEVRISVIVRPILSELYQLDTEIGPNYYDEVVGPEARSATRDLVAREPVHALMKPSEKLEDEIESSVRERIRGKHVEVASVVVEGVTFAKELADAMRARVAADQRAATERHDEELRAEQKTQDLEEEYAQKRAELEAALARRRAEIDAAVPAPCGGAAR